MLGMVAITVDGTFDGTLDQAMTTTEVSDGTV